MKLLLFPILQYPLKKKFPAAGRYIKLYVMNYLAHAYLSFDRPGILLGNMISDFVKGRKKYDYPQEILFGINLHRSIDDFTDTHAQTKKAKAIYEADYGLYSGAFMDVSYDYFIANDSSLFSNTTLEAFSLGVYQSLESNSQWFPAGFAGMFPHMKQHNWLLNYRTETGIQRSFEGLVHRAAYMDDSTEAFSLFLANTRQLETAYRIFFPELVAFTQDILTRNNM